MSELLRFVHVLSARSWRRLGIAFVLVAIPVLGFVQWVDEVRDQDTLPYDEAILRAINTISSPWLDALVVALTQLGGVVGVIVLTAGIVALLWQRRHRLDATLLAIGVGGAALLNVLFKAVFQRDRPQLWERIVTENSYSFPSGHAMASCALAISLIFLLWPTRWRWWALVGGVLYMGVIAFTRMYLGVHYPTDILAGWAVSTAWVAIVFGLVRYRSRVMNLFKRRV